MPSGPRILSLLLALILACLGQMAAAHPMPQSSVEVRALEDRWRLELTLPADRLVTALVQAGEMPDPGPGFTKYPRPDLDVVGRYIRSHIVVKSADGTDWSEWIERMIPPTTDDPAAEGNEWKIEVDLIPPAGASDERLDLNYDVITRELVTHSVIATMSEDVHAGFVSGEPKLLGTLDAENTSLSVTHGAGGHSAFLWSMLTLGMDHILEGSDHLAFLLVLMLTVPLFAAGGQWRPEAARRRIVSNALWRVSAFTGGHTLSLLATSLGWLPQAGIAIEVLIAASVGITAVNAIRPVFPRHEAWVALFFGLVHGMAFATTIRDLSLSTGQTLLAVFGFNIGVELVQLALVALVVPALVLIRFTRWERPVRLVIAFAALAAAIWWAGTRLLYGV